MNKLFNCNPELFLDSLPGCPLQIGKIHGSRKKKRGQSRITGKIKDSNSRSMKKIKLNSRITEKIRGGQFTVHEENKTQFTVHSKK